MTGSRRILYPLGAAVILAYFFFFTWKSLFLYFDADDMYNLYFAWSKPLGEVLRSNLFFWNGFVRPMGAVFYRAIFAVAGFHPLPFHVALLGLGVCNIALCFWFVRLVSHSDRTAALATLLFAFHTRLMEVWFRTGVVYDALCFTFLYAGACLYIGARQEGRQLGAGRIAAILACYLCALDAKEMAVFLPVLLLSYEFILNTANRKSLVPSRAAGLIAVLALMIVPYAIGKLHGPGAMANNPDYRPEFSYARYANTWSVYLEHLFVRDTPVPEWTGMIIVGALAAGALALRSRLLIFAWSVIVFGLLPVSFAPARGAFVMFISWPGWVIYAAALLVALQDPIMRSHPQYRTALACAVFVLAGWRMGKFNLHDQRADPRHWLYDTPALVRAMSRQMMQQHPSLPLGTRILMTADPFSTGEYTPNFVMNLLYRDPSLKLDRVGMMEKAPANWDGYQYVFTYEGNSYKQLKP
jgi:hypothetical protein